MSKSNPKSPGGARKKREAGSAAVPGPAGPRPKAAVRQTSEKKQSAAEPEPADPQTNLPHTEMEVHHHPQLEHKPKSWKEYLLEGFMIFIAVMMGFIAENIREDITNSEHARRLTLQLVYDLKADTVQLNEIFRAEIQIVNNNDTLFSLLQQPFEKADKKRIQKLVAYSHSLWPFHPSAGAIAAIKNELHLKQLSNSDIIGYISTYEKHTELLRTVQDIALQYQRSFLDPFLRFHLTPDNLDAAFNHTAAISSQMRNLTPEDLTQLRADMVLVRINSRELVTNNRKLMHDAESLLAYVKKQYHPGDE
ncbi:MAG: hypothetical protein JWR05_1406 [Mucilaginibacter sp.]|nr:hypothetical protein [Mucilaginibacter sp.]